MVVWEGEYAVSRLRWRLKEKRERTPAGKVLDLSAWCGICCVCVFGKGSGVGWCSDAGRVGEIWWDKKGAGLCKVREGEGKVVAVYE